MSSQKGRIKATGTTSGYISLDFCFSGVYCMSTVCTLLLQRSNLGHKEMLVGVNSAILFRGS